MKVRWRDHEFVLVTMSAAILLGGYLWRIFRMLPGQFRSIYEAPFIANHIPFNLYRNVLLPEIGMGLLVYVSYLWLHFFSLPRFFSGKNNLPPTPGVKSPILAVLMNVFARKGYKRYALLILQFFIIFIVLGAAYDISLYFRYQSQFSYPGFSFFPKMGYNPYSQIDVHGTFMTVLAACLWYSLYIFAREIIIRLIEMPDGKNVYRVLICNRITSFLVIYTCIPFFAAVFHLVHGGRIIEIYYSFVVPIFLVYMINTYWLFPFKGNSPFFSFNFIMRLFITTFLCSTMALLSPFYEGPFFRIWGLWAFLSGVVTPITWLLYQQQKDKILQLKGAQKELVKSKADLQFLRSQINPHFLFNTLNTIYGTALQENAERTGGAIQRLGDMMRFMLYENTRDFIDMNKEIGYLENYISLQKMRTVSSPDILIESHIDEQHCNHRIAPMLLIPLVENAFKHGINLDKRSWIIIDLHCNKQEISFTVRNSIHP